MRISLSDFRERKLKRITSISSRYNFLLSFSFHFIRWVTLWCVCVCRAYGFFSFFSTSRQCVKFGFYRFLFNIRIRLRRCNDGIMMIVAKMAKDLKCDNVCLPLLSLLHWLLFDENCDVALITLQNQTYAHTQTYLQHGGQWWKQINRIKRQCAGHCCKSKHHQNHTLPFEQGERVIKPLK